MSATAISVEAIAITGGKGLDPIEVFWRNIEPGRGSVTITCFGCAWTVYFGAIGNRTIQQFFMDADTGYLVNKLGITPMLKQRKVDHAYLGRIITAVKVSMACGRAPAA